jgi:hypothetical protein
VPGGDEHGWLRPVRLCRIVERGNARALWETPTSVSLQRQALAGLSAGSIAYLNALWRCRFHQSEVYRQGQHKGGKGVEDMIVVLKLKFFGDVL